MAATLPVIDFSRWLEGSPEEKRQVAHDLAEACRRVGFVYLTNHGVPNKLVEEAFGWSKKLFDLPQQQKMLAPHPPGPDIHRGYSWPGLEKVSQYMLQDGADADEENRKLRAVQDCKESYEIGSEGCAAQPNQWLPEAVLPGFRAFTTGFYWTCSDTAKELLKALAVGIGLDDDEFLVRFHSGDNNQLRLLHYPPVERDKLCSNAIARMPAHSDWGSLTMLFQDDCGGLQVEAVTAPGAFVDARPMEGALVMNVGDLLMRWSNGEVLLRCYARAWQAERPPADTKAHATCRVPQVDAASGHGAAGRWRGGGRRHGHDEGSLFHPVLCVARRSGRHRMPAWVRERGEPTKVCGGGAGRLPQAPSQAAVRRRARFRADMIT